jgi:hypothetical protein
MAETAAPTQWEPIPIVLGVVGHRDIAQADEEKLTAAIVAEIKAFQAAYPGTPIVVLTSLAQGADLLGARAAVKCGCKIRAPLPMPREHYQQSSSFDVDARYEERIQELNHYLDLETPKTDYFAVPFPASIQIPALVTWEHVRRGNSVENAEKYRRQLYAVAGHFVVTHCDVLIALWDGEPGDPAKPSGTAEHIRFQIDGIPQTQLPKELLEPLGYFCEREPVVVIHTPREKKRDESKFKLAERRVIVPEAVKLGEHYEIDTPRPNTTLGVNAGPVDVARGERTPAIWRWFVLFVTRIEWRELLAAFSGLIDTGYGVVNKFRKLLGHSKIQRRFHHPTRTGNVQKNDELKLTQERCAAINRYNHECRCTIRKNDLEEIHSNVSKDISRFSGIQSKILHNYMHNLVNHRRYASQLSSILDYDSWLWRTGLLILLFLSQFCFHYYAHLPGKQDCEEVYNPTSLALAFVIFLIALITPFGLRFVQTHSRKLDARALSEALRVRLWWGYTGISRHVGQAYLQQTRSEVSWIRQALMSISPPSAFWKDEFDNVLSPEQQKNRIEFAMKFWVKDQAKYFYENQAKFHHLAALWRLSGFAIAVGLGFLPMAWILLGANAFHPNHYILLAMGIGLIGGGLMIGYAEQNSFEELAKQYGRAHTVFSLGLRELNQALEANDIPKCQSILQSLGQEAIAENAQWLIIRRNRPVDLHVG